MPFISLMTGVNSLPKVSVNFDTLCINKYSIPIVLTIDKLTDNCYNFFGRIQKRLCFDLIAVLGKTLKGFELYSTIGHNSINIVYAKLNLLFAFPAPLAELCCRSI